MVYLFKWQLPKGIFTSGNFPNVKISKAATSQVPKSVLAVAPGPLACSSPIVRPPGPN